MLIGLVALAFWPGVPMYDTVTQYGEVLSGEVDDWHPPVMVRLWQLLHPLGPTTAPMFVLQASLYALGFLLCVSALVRSGRPGGGLAAALLGLSPLLLGWQMVVLKDAQMLGAMVAAVGIVAHYRLREAPVPALFAAGAVLLLVYATLVRANSLFATVPLAIFLTPWPRAATWRAGLAAAAILLLIAVEPPINHRIFGATPSGVATSQPMFDLAAIAASTASSVPPFKPAERAALIQKHCVNSFFWDPITEPDSCGPETERIDALSERELYLDLARAAVAHPVAYLQHRLAHWNSTERWLVPPGLIDAEPPDEAEPNDEGLETPSSSLVPEWQRRAGTEAQTPLGWPIFWTTVALLLTPIAWRRRGEPEADLATALLISALTLEGSFLVVSIASDLRYHLWTLTAVPLAVILLGSDVRVSRKEWIGGVAALALVIGGGFFTRLTLPRAPDSYQAMLHAPSG